MPGLNGKFTLTAPRGSSEILALLKLEQLLEKMEALLAKLDADPGVSDVDYSDLLADVRSIRDELVNKGALEESL